MVHGLPVEESLSEVRRLNAPVPLPISPCLTPLPEPPGSSGSRNLRAPESQRQRFLLARFALQVPSSPNPPPPAVASGETAPDSGKRNPWPAIALRNRRAAMAGVGRRGERKGLSLKRKNLSPPPTPSRSDTAADVILRPLGPGP